MITPYGFYTKLCTIQDYRRDSIEEKQLREFIQNATLKDFEELMLWCVHLQTNYNVHWLEQVKVSLNIRIAEQASKSANKLIEHSEQLTNQTEQVIRHSQMLTRQTDILIAESKSLGRLTWVLVGLTLVLAILTAALLFIDWKK